MTESSTPGSSSTPSSTAHASTPNSNTATGIPSAHVGLLTSRSPPIWARVKHDAEQEQHHHRPDVDKHLRDGHELGRGEDVLRRDTGEHEHQPQRGVNDIVRAHDPDRGDDHHQGDHREPDVLGDVDIADGDDRGDGRAHFFFSAPASSSGASGTVSIHSPSLALSCRRSAMRGSLYSYSGLQNKASNGQTSTQMPQYMHSA